MVTVTGDSPAKKGEKHCRLIKARGTGVAKGTKVPKEMRRRKCKGDTNTSTLQRNSKERLQKKKINQILIINYTNRFVLKFKKKARNHRIFHTL